MIISDQNSKYSVALIMLSAGASTRMGRPKQLLPWKNKTLLEHCLEQVLKSEVANAVLVLGANHELIASQVETGRASIVINDHWEQGMSGSIREGLAFLEKSGVQYHGVMITLSDQPLLDANFYKQLINIFLNNTGKIVSAAYENGFGVPAIFPRPFFAALRNLKGDRGARSVIQAHRDEVLAVDASSLTEDLDTMEQYLRLYKRIGR